ncbi:hypothetical protein DE4585_01594 [Mycobacteroides salmoniphilum]|uniref:Uncharacterized protein n=1 Tax=Mycobacteroides salmoniphilum TaxID=404941 RepID=A0A4R8S0S4_9MYCO|nr:hypothetical protein [Mycobacteroides salmoniphilum]TDZ82802.1 hypothetical protein DE4585_01594 [Mycobacteroides salmoniphilum]
MSGSVVVIGIDPYLIDFSMPEFASTGLTADDIQEGLDKSAAILNAEGYTAELCLIGVTPDQVTAQLKRALDARPWDCVVIGAGIRAMRSNLELFEIVLNVVHAHAPHAKICFNTTPTDTVSAVERWI